MMTTHPVHVKVTKLRPGEWVLDTRFRAFRLYQGGTTARDFALYVVPQRGGAGTFYAYFASLEAAVDFIRRNLRLNGAMERLCRSRARGAAKPGGL